MQDALLFCHIMVWYCRTMMISCTGSVGIESYSSVTLMFAICVNNYNDTVCIQDNIVFFIYLILITFNYVPVSMTNIFIL